MEINITGDNIEITDPLREVINRKLNKVVRHFNNNIISLNVILKNQKLNNIVEATLHVSGAEINAKGISDTMYKAIDVMVNKLDRQIRRYKTRLEDRKFE